MKQTFVRLIGIVIVALWFSVVCHADPKEFNSLYNFVSIDTSGDIVTFSYKYNGARMSSINLTNEAYQVVPYTRYLFSPIFVKKNPKKCLLIGLGAGAYNRLYTKIFPSSQLITLEIDSMIRKLAREYAKFIETEKNTVIVQDARIYLKKVKETWDWIIVDAFDIEANIPVHLTTVEFYKLLSGRLNDDGAMAINLHSSKPLLYSQVATLAAVFPQVILFYVPNRGNVVALCSKHQNSDLISYIRNIDVAELPNLVDYGVDFKEMQIQSESSDYILQGKSYIILTDDYAPVDILAK
jgi:spermidine synthase